MRPMAALTPLLAGLLLAAGACNRTAPTDAATTDAATLPPTPDPPPPPADGAPAEPVPTPEDAAPHPATPAPDADAAPEVEAAPEPDASEAAGPDWQYDLCRGDGDCGWDNPCVPTRCVASDGAKLDIGCDKTVPPDGACRCIDGRCTFRRASPERGDSPDAGCRRDDQCGLDLAGGRCLPIPDRTEGPLLGPIETEGPYCVCEPDAGACRYRWSPALPCRSFRDCGMATDGGRRHPAPPAEPRRRPVRPCADAESDSTCPDTPEPRVCRLVFWSC